MFQHNAILSCNQYQKAKLLSLHSNDLQKLLCLPYNMVIAQTSEHYEDGCLLCCSAVGDHHHPDDGGSTDL
jgi:hypothetical protein